jgi:transcriptional regulator with XRE-family HTH domain
MMLMAEERKRRGRPKGTPNKTPNVLGRNLSANARRILALRQQHGLTQPQMAELLDVEVNTVSRWERGVINCPQRVVRLAEALLAARELRQKLFQVLNETADQEKNP